MSEIKFSARRTTQTIGFNFKMKQEGGVCAAEIPELKISVRADAEADARTQARAAIKKYFEDAKPW